MVFAGLRAVFLDDQYAASLFVRHGGHCQGSSLLDLDGWTTHVVARHASDSVRALSVRRDVDRYRVGPGVTAVHPTLRFTHPDWIQACIDGVRHCDEMLFPLLSDRTRCECDLPAVEVLHGKGGIIRKCRSAMESRDAQAPPACAYLMWESATLPPFDRQAASPPPFLVEPRVQLHERKSEVHCT